MRSIFLWKACQVCGLTHLLYYNWNLIWVPLKRLSFDENVQSFKVKNLHQLSKTLESLPACVLHFCLFTCCLMWFNLSEKNLNQIATVSLCSSSLLLGICCSSCMCIVILLTKPTVMWFQNTILIFPTFLLSFAYENTNQVIQKIRGNIIFLSRNGGI